MPMGLLAARVPVASKIHVPVGLHKWDLEGAQSMNVVVEGGVGVPGFPKAGAVGMEEDESGREGAVVVDNVAEIGH